MTIEYVKGDIFCSPAQTIVNTVNSKGVMGKGLALQFKKRYPAMYEEYKKACEQGKLRVGVLLPPYKVNERRWILNFPTKNDWRFKSSLKYIESGLICFIEKYKEWGITSIAFPRLGCQFGGLSWKDVKPLMARYLENLPDLKVSVYSYAPKKRIKRKQRKAKRKIPSSSKISTSQQKLPFYS
jgi:O-acetyl-ADP-ribose deacetylase (regulator of RNase III)